jgi:sugar lactone lactonase YvrE
MENIMIRRLLALFVAVAILVPAVQASADTVYAVSNNDGRIIRFDSANPSGSVVTLSGSGAIVNAAGLALGPDGNLYIGESGNVSTIAPAIRRLDLSSNTLSTVYTFSEFDVFPGALAFKGNDLIIGRNPFFGDTGAVMRLSNATGGTTSVSTYTSGFLLASSPGLAFGADGALYVSSMNYNFGTKNASGSIVKFDSTGGYLTEVVAGGGSTGLLGPTGLGIKGTNLYAASIMNGSVLATNLLSGSTSAFGQTGVPFGASPLAMLSDGGLIVGSAGNAAGAIYRFDAAGNLVDTFNSGLGTIGGVVAVPEPSTAVAAAIGVAAAAWMRRRRMAGS